MASKIQVDKISRNSGTPEFTIPTADGAANTFLKTDGSGVLSFAANLTYDGNTLDVKNAGTASSLKLYCESSNAHYTEIKSGPHSGATQYTLTLPNAPPTTSGQVLSATTAGVASWATASDVSGLASVQTFTSSGTWTRPTGITKVIMEVQGAGGGGSRNASDNNRCISGAAGGYAKKFLDVSSISTSTITIGAAGTGGATSGDPGTVGGNSSWADGTNTIAGNASATAALANDTKQVVVGGTATGGDVNIPGQMGGAPNDGWGPPDSMLGKGGGFASSGYYAAGENDATGYGAGGGGSGDYRGGNGTAGIVIVWEYK